MTRAKLCQPSKASCHDIGKWESPLKPLHWRDIITLSLFCSFFWNSVEFGRPVRYIVTILGEQRKRIEKKIHRHCQRKVLAKRKRLQFLPNGYGNRGAWWCYNSGIYSDIIIHLFGHIRILIENCPIIFQNFFLSAYISLFNGLIKF